MKYARLYVCDSCKQERESQAHPNDPSEHDGGRCSCGGRYYYAGETYDQEFVDEQRYNEQQDREYEDRHRHDRY